MKTFGNATENNIIPSIKYISLYFPVSIWTALQQQLESDFKENKLYKFQCIHIDYNCEQSVENMHLHSMHVWKLLK